MPLIIKSHQDHHGQEEVSPGLQHHLEASGFFTQALSDPLLGRLQIHDDKNRQKIKDGWKQGRLHHLDVFTTDDLGHHERRGAHYGRHELTTGRGDRFDRRGDMRFVTGFLHQGDGKGAGGHHVGGRGSGQGAHQGAADHGGLGRPASQLSGQGIGQVDEQFAAAEFLENTSENDEQGDVFGRHTHRNAIDAFGGGVHELQNALQGVEAMPHGSRNPGAEVGIQDKKQSQGCQDPPDDPPRGLENHHQGKGADHDVRGVGHARVIGDAGPVGQDIHTGKRGHRRPDRVDRRDSMKGTATGRVQDENDDRQDQPVGSPGGSWTNKRRKNRHRDGTNQARLRPGISTGPRHRPGNGSPGRHPA